MGDRRAATIAWLGESFEGRGDLDAASEHLAPAVLKQIDAVKLVEQLTTIADGRRVDSVDAGPIPASVCVTLRNDAHESAAEPLLRVECVFDDLDRLLGISVVPPEHANLSVRTEQTASLSSADRDQAHALFDRAYDRANHTYLDASLETLRWVTMARDGEKLVGFSLGEQRRLDLPRVGPTRATLAGLACVDPAVRRRGLFRRLSNLVLAADGPITAEGVPVLGAGRMAHPASYRIYRPIPTVVPKGGVTPNEFQQAVGSVVAQAYRVADFDPATFVCRGQGTPIGYPNMNQEVEADEWDVFAAVDRDRGDALLALIWQPSAPDGWLEATD